MSVICILKCIYTYFIHCTENFQLIFHLISSLVNYGYYKIFAIENRRKLEKKKTSKETCIAIITRILIPRGSNEINILIELIGSGTINILEFLLR